MSEVFHDDKGVFFHGHDCGDVVHNGQGQAPINGLHPERAGYGSCATSSDPDGNGWVLQEITQRAPGR
ncbi:hypothetical protein [Streptomyces adustus]|uniref:hypothetical protein n=1 Tax=Streptomyces adustus TaxID=1609272 RepID=UPI00192E5861